MLIFAEENPRGKGENQQTTQLTWSTRVEDRTHDPLDHSGERRAYYRNITHARWSTFLSLNGALGPV
jgi:hypothetical protein